MYDLGCPSDYTVDIYVITMVRIRLWLFGIISAMLGLRMLQLLCRLPIKLHSYLYKNTLCVRFELLAIAFVHILIGQIVVDIIYNNADEINSEFGRDYCSGD